MRLRMRRKKDEQEKDALPDLSCCVCIQKKACGQAEENKFCSRFASRKYVPKQDPTEIWEEMQKARFRKPVKQE